MESVVGRGTLLAGRYRTLQPLASDLPGGSSWEATDQILDRPVRVTVLHAGHVPQALDAARRAALVTDPRLARVLDVGEHEGVAYTVTEQVSGPSLAELVARGPLPADQARAIVGEAASALEVARRRGVHHLTLRPSVLHLTPDDRVLITGLAVDGALLGRDRHDADVATRMDTVGLVGLLYAALTGRWPRTVGGTTEGPLPHLAAAPVLEGAPVPPAELASGVPNDLDTLCAVTLGVHDDGPRTPAELVEELEPWGDIRATDLFAGTQVLPTLPPTAPTAPVPAADVPATPARVQRTSVRQVFAGSRPAPRPGTPPPAIPSRSSAFTGPVVGAAAVGAAAAGAPVHPPAAAPASSASSPAPAAAPARPVPDDAPTTTLPAATPGPAATAATSAAATPAPSTPAPSTPAPTTPAPTVPAPTTPAPRSSPAPGATPAPATPTAPVASAPTRPTSPVRPAAAQAPAPADAATPPHASAPAGQPSTASTAPSPGDAAPTVVQPIVPPAARAASAAAAATTAEVSPAPGATTTVPAPPAPTATTTATATASTAPPAATATPAAPPTGTRAGSPDDDDAAGRSPLLPLGPRPGGLDVAAARETIAAHRFDPTRFVLLLVGLAIVVGLFTAYRALTRPVDLGAGSPDPVATQSAPAEAPAEEPAAEEPAPAPAAPAAPPVIASAAQLDPPPDGDENEHPEAVPRAIDGDPATTWFTRTYNGPDFAGLKSGVGYAVTLAEPATVTTVTLQVQGSGGRVEVRATDPTTPTEGPVLAEGALGPETVLTLAEPTEAQHIVLWFTELPQAQDGANRLELAEVTLS